MARTRSGLIRDALHQIAVTADDIHVVIGEVETWPIEAACHPLTCYSHAHTSSNALAEGTGRGLNPEVQRYSGWPAHLLSSCRKRLMSSSVTDRWPSVSYLRIDGLHASEVQKGIPQH